MRRFRNVIAITFLTSVTAGSITGVLHDAAIVYPPGRAPYVLVVLTRSIPDAKLAELLIPDISRLVWAYAVPSGPGETQ